MIPREIIEEIVRRSDIEQVIGSYVTLKRAGSNMVGLCPFHSEKSPSFTVFSGSDSFYCFGCGAGGDVITFIMKAENLDYVSAVEFLAKRAGIEIPEDRSGYDRGPGRERIRQMNVAAAKFFHNCLLNDPDAQEARRYLREKRCLSDATVKHFYLGYAPDSFDRLKKHLSAAGFTYDEMTAGFLCGKSQKNGNIYDLFRNRVMFPIVDTSRNIIAFGGRVMDDSKPKYLNSSDTPAFKKSRNLFALNYAKDHCSERLILCEGYMDVIAMHQAGFQNAVATLGTAITEEHARIIARYTKQVILSYDSDGAGIAATNKAMKILSSVGVEVRILHMDNSKAKDPDEFIKKYGAQEFRYLLEGSRTGFEYKLENVAGAHDLSVTEEKLKAAEEITAVISDYYSEVEREVYVARAAERLGLPADALRADVTRRRSRKIREIYDGQTKEAHSSIRYFSDKVNPEAASNIRAASAEETVLGLLLIYPEYRDAVQNGSVALESQDFFTTFGRSAFDAIMELHASSGGFVFALLGEKFDSDAVGRLRSCEIKRRSLNENGIGVLTAAASVLRAERTKEAEKSGAGGNLADSIAERRRRLEEEKKKRGG